MSTNVVHHEKIRKRIPRSSNVRGLLTWREMSFRKSDRKRPPPVNSSDHETRMVIFWTIIMAVLGMIPFVCFMIAHHWNPEFLMYEVKPGHNWVP